MTENRKLFYVLVLNVREQALPVIRGITDVNGALTWRALATRCDLITAPRVQSSMSAILNAKFFPSKLKVYVVALDERQENTRKLGAISGDCFNALVKKAVFLENAPSSV